MHVVQVRDAQQQGECRPDQAGLFMRVHRVVAARQRATKDAEREQRVERNLRQRRTHFHAPQERRPQAPEHAQSRQRDVLSKRIRDQIDLVPERGQRPEAMKLAEGSAARLEERLGRDHQDAHGSGDFRTKS